MFNVIYSTTTGNAESFAIWLTNQLEHLGY